MTNYPYFQLETLQNRIKTKTFIDQIISRNKKLIINIEKNLGIDYIRELADVLEKGYVLSTIDYWNTKLLKNNYSENLIEKFVISKFIELFAFKKQVLREKKNISEVKNVEFPEYVSKKSVIEKIAIIIPFRITNIQGQHMLKRAIKCVENQKRRPDSIILINDNSEVDYKNSPSSKLNTFYIENEIRKGPAYSRNLGTHISIENDTDLIVYLDYDVMLPKNWISLVEGIVTNNTCDLVAGILNSYSSTWWDFYHDINGTLNGRVFKQNNMVFATTACLAVKKEVIEKIKFNDEKFSDAAGEDIDFCLKARKKGFKIKFDNRLHAKHDYGYKNQFNHDINLFYKRFIRYGAVEDLICELNPDLVHDLAKSDIIHSSMLKWNNTKPEMLFTS